MSASKPIIFYDIASPAGAYASSTWKTRYILNLKGLDYQTEWVDRLDIPLVRQKLNAPPKQYSWDGSPYHSLPIIQDQATGEIVADSFDNAIYLEKTYPSTPSLFPPSTVALQAAFNKQIDTIFLDFAILYIYDTPLSTETIEKAKAAIVRRMRKEKWEDFKIQGEERARVLEQFKTALGEVAKFYARTDGLFLGGESPLYADLVLGGWLKMMKIVLREWEEVQTWHDGLWGRIYQALEKYTEVK